MGVSLFGSFDGRGAWGINLYNVSHREYTKYRYWARDMACSSVTTPPIMTYQVKGGKRDLVNQSTNSWSKIVALISHRRHLHSWIWSEIWVEVDWHNDVKISIPISYLISNWKCVKNSIERELDSSKEFYNSSIYHLAMDPIRVHWKSCNRMELSMKEFEEQHRWKVITWLLGYSPGFPSNLGILEGCLEGMGGQKGECCMGSLVNHEISGKSKFPKNKSVLLTCGGGLYDPPPCGCCYGDPPP